jgi:hypothetical protein
MKTTLLPALVLLLLVLAGCDSATGPVDDELGLPAAAGSSIIGKVVQDPENDSGIHGRFFVQDNGYTLKLRGTAVGLNPENVYVSLIYDIASPDEGPEACEPGIFDPADPNFILNTMFFGVWTVDAAGNGTLDAVNIVDDGTGERVYVPTSKIGTISIRDTSINGGFGPEAVMACGALRLL